MFICDECVDLCNDIIREEIQEKTGSGSSSRLPAPREIDRILNDYVVGQASCEEGALGRVYNHYKRLDSGVKVDEVELSKSNVLLIGPTGCGKTLLAETLARLLNVPFTIADATTLTEAGYVGEDVENIIQKLLQKCDYDVEKAQTGIVYIDEIDKISRKSDNPSITRDVSGEGVQQALLKLIEGTVASVPPRADASTRSRKFLQVDTSNILFICGGWRWGLDKNHRAPGLAAWRHRLRGGREGQGRCQEGRRDSQGGGAEDLIHYGLIPEFVGRLPILATLEELDEAQLVQILTEPKNALVKQYGRLFQMEGTEVEFREGCARERRPQGHGAKDGARRVSDPSSSTCSWTRCTTCRRWKNVAKVVVDESVIEGESSPLLIYEGDKQRAAPV